ncbi:MAG TPA: lipoyl synthase [Candidatus Thermoplasmatota archaeon]|nr:lipoyl synthase [Candidatus Thermoplasmatota archaeon]
MTGLPNLPIAGVAPTAAPSGKPRLPEWFKVKPPGGQAYAAIKQALRERGLSTVCEEARCPNLAECWGGGSMPGQEGARKIGTATIMVMGGTCTRGCRFCSVPTGKPGMLDGEEPRKASETVGLMGVGYVVITSVDRDDLPDGGADHFGRVIERCKADHPELLVEVLTPDFQGDEGALRRIVAAKPDVVAHNVETVRRLTPAVRDRRAGYDQTLQVLRDYKRLGARFTKTSIMLGLGETQVEVEECLRDLRAAGVDIVTFGQYLRPTQEARHLAVTEFVHPRQFDAYAAMARAMGFLYVASGPLVRSSYKAGELFLEGMIRGANPRVAQ